MQNLLRNLLPAFVLSIACALTGCATTTATRPALATKLATKLATEPATKLTTELATALNTAMHASLAHHKAAAIGIGVIRSGALAWSAVYGEQAPGVPATRQTLFNVASLAKPISAEVVLQLVNDNRVRLDEPMSESWVDAELSLDPRHSLVTPRLALSHQTGFPNWRQQSSDKKLAFIAAPGSGFNYSGEGYEYLRRFIEKKTGESFESLADAHVFKRLRMTRTAYSERPWMQGHVAMPMTALGATASPDLAATGKGNAADNLFTTVDDFAALMLSVVNGDGLSLALARERLRPQVPMPQANACAKRPLPAGCPTATHFTLGWVAYQFGAQTVLSNSGKDWGEFALVYIDPATRDGMLYFVNGGNGVPVAMDAMALLDPSSPVAAVGRVQMGQVT